MAYFPWEEIRATWVTDSFGVLSLHKNDANLNFKESYVGELENKDGIWGYRLKDKEFVSCISYADALIKLRNAIT
jgi:hypothetical protein